MTDLEATQLCAEAMGISAYLGHSGKMERDPPSREIYDPLHNDAQCMALVKKYPWECLRAMDEELGKTDPDLNTAIVHCVAQMQAGKKCPPSA